MIKYEGIDILKSIEQNYALPNTLKMNKRGDSKYQNDQKMNKMIGIIRDQIYM